MVEKFKKCGVRERKKARTRNKILGAALKLFAKKGFEQTSIDMLAREAGIGKGTIYSYFSTKSEIFLAFCEEELEFVYSELKGKTDRQTVLLERLMTLYMGQFCYVSRNREFGRQLMRELIFPKELTVERSRELDNRFIDMLRPILQKAQQRGELRKDLPLIFVMGHFYSLYVMVVSGWYMGRLHTEEDVSESMRMLFSQALEGLAPTKGYLE